MIPADTAADPSMHEEQLQAVNEALDDLVAAKELVSKRVTIISPVGAKDEDMKAIAGVIQLLGEEYGIFVASEMCDLGARLKFMVMMPDQPLELNLRLPDKYLKIFIDKASPILIQN